MRSSPSPVHRPSLRLRVVIAIACGALLCGAVATAAASPASIDVSPATLSSVTTVRGTVGVPAAGATNGTGQEITQAFDPGFLRIDDAGRVTAPQGWAVTYSTDGTTFGSAPATASAWAQVRAVRATGTTTGTAATGGTTSQSVAAPPSGAFSGGGGGDGWNVFFDNANHVFNIWHHNGSPWGSYNPRVDCHTRTGGSCGPGWPFSLAGLYTGMQSPGWVDTATGHLWFPTNDNGTQTGFACVDVGYLGSGPAWCGGSSANAFRGIGSGGPSGGNPADSLCNPSYPFSCVVGLAVAGSRIYSAETRTGKILCLDMAAAGGTGAACAGQPYAPTGVSAVPWQVALAGGGGLWLPALLNVEGRIIGTGRGSYSDSTSPVSLFCLVGATGAPCPGWSVPKVVGNPASGATTPWLTYAEPSASGAINGVCVRPVTLTSGGTPTCFALDGSAITGNAAIAGTFRQAAGGENGIGAAATTGSRVYWGNGTYNDAQSRLYCSDAQTNADCAGWPVVTETAPGSGNLDNYVVVVDPLNAGCLWVNSDSSGIYQYSSAGTRGCAGVPASNATFTATSLVAPQRVSCGGTPAWGTLAVTSPVPAAYATASLTVLDASGAVVVSGGTTWSGVPIGAGGSIDLSGLAQADTGANPQFVVSFTGRTNTAAIAATIATPAHAPELCLDLIPQEVPCPHATAPSGSLAAWTSVVSGSGVQGATAVDAAEATVTFANAATGACVPAPPPAAPPPSASPASTASPAPDRLVAPRVTEPRVAPMGTAIVTSVSVRAPGTVRQRGIHADGATACTSRSHVVRAPGQVAVVCRLTSATMADLRRGPVRIRLLTTLRTADGVVRGTRTVTIRWRPEPVTG